MSLQGVLKRGGVEKAVPSLVSKKNLTVSQKHERRVESKVGGRRQAGSGNQQWAKGDIKTDTHLIECKTTEKKSMSIKAEWLAKITEEAQMEGRMPAVQISFENMQAGVDKDWIMVPMTQLDK